MRIKNYRKRSIGTLVVLLFVLSFSITPALLFSNYSFGSGFKNPTDEEQNTDDLNLSNNYLFKGTSYTFNLDDFYDDANLYKVYTGAKFQTEAFNQTLLDWSGTINNDTVTPVDNDETQYGTPSGDYNGTYSFEGDANGVYTTNSDAEDNIGFVDQARDLSATETVSILAEFEGHKKVLRMSNIGGTEYDPLIWNFFDGQTFGIVEFWIYIPSTNLMYFIFSLGSNDISLRFDENGNIYTEGSVTTTPYDLDTWNHIKVDFDCNGSVGSNYDFYLNNDFIGNMDFDDNESQLSQIYMWCRGDQSVAYIDALGIKTGYYPATYSFEGDTLDGNPAGWSITEDGGTVNVIAKKDGHNKVLEFYDDDPTYRVDATNTFTIQTDGTIEFWWAYNANETLNHYFLMQFKESGSTRFYLCLNYLWGRLGSIQYRDSTGYHPTGYYDNPINTMVHIKLEFDDTNNEAEFTVNNVSYGELPYFSNSTIGIDNIFMFTRTVNGGGPYWHWIDAVGYSGDPDYNIGDNIYPWDSDYTIGENLYPDNINMIEGSYDYTDNMKINDDSSTNFTSTHTDGWIYETPNQWDDFIFTNGTGITIGEIETIDANSSVIQDDYFGIDDYVTIIPDGDGTPLQWMPNPAGTHWTKIDEDPDSNDGTSTQLVVVMDSNKIDVINYTSGDIEGASVYKIVVRYAYKGVGPAGYDAYIDINLGGWLGYKKVTRPGVDFTAQDLEWAGLSGDQTDVNGLQVRLKSYISGLNANYFTAIWVKVYYSSLDIDLDVQVDMQVDDPDCSSIEYFKYSHKTNVSATIDLDIWNWDTTTWFEIESVDNFASFDDDSFTLGLDSDYVNSSFGVRIRFQLNTGTNDFELQIDRLRLDYLTTPAELEMTITFSFTDYNEDLLGMTVQSWQKTNISQTIIFKIWNYNTETWVQISSSSDTSFTKKEYNTPSPTDFISSSGVVKLNWTGLNTTNDFELHIDYLFIQIYYKLDLVHEKSFDTNGIYRYRWVVLGSIHYTDWVVFEVVDPEDNFHAISESDNPTRWLLQGAALSPFENFTDDIDPSSAWDLYDTSPTDFNKYIPELDNYLTDYITFYGSSYESPAQWGEFDFTKGAGNTVGELETNDADEAIVDTGATYNGESLLGTIEPADSDILTGWNDGDAAPHWSKIDETIFAWPDGGNIRESSTGVHDKWNFNTLTIPADHVVTKLVLFSVCQRYNPSSAYIIFTTSVGADGSWVPDVDAYDSEQFTVTDLDFGQAELNAFWMNVEVRYILGGGWADIETIWVNVYTSLKEYSVDYSITWDVTDPESIENFNYDYRTTYSVDCDLDIYNWDTTGWLELESNTDVNWHADNYTLTDPYISGDEIKIRFQSALTTTNFDMELDMIVLEYNSIYTISKKHNNTIPGYAYMQTNTTELISLNSSVYGSNYTLSSGEYFEIDFQTSSDSQINLVLLRDGVVNKTLILSQSGNTNFNRRTIQISVDETVEFDQLRFSSTFEDTDYVRIYDIKTYKYIITGDSADFYVGSHQDYELYLTPDFYNLRIHNPYDGEVKVNTNITISSGYNFHIYQPVKSILCRITLFSPEGDYLQFEDYHIKINRSLNEEYNQFDLVDTLFYADEETYIYIEVYDRFDASINIFSRLASSYIDLEIEVYSLQIKNLQTQKTTVDINTTHVYPLLSEESIYFMLAKDYYQIGYYDTNNVYKQFLIYLDSNQAYELNRSKICFLAYVNQKGEHLYFDDYKTYINDSLIYENVFYREIGDDIGIEVKDIYGISIKNQTYTVVSGDNYIPVVLTMYSLKVMNMQEQFNHINITRDPNYYESGYYWSEWIAPNEIIKFRLFPGYYKINLTDNENGAYSNYAYTLNGDDILLISSGNILSQVIYNIANVNTTIGNQITNVEINITNQNSEINNTIVNIEINLSNVNSTLGNLLTNIDVNILNLESDINSLYLFTNTSIWNLNSAMNNSFIYLENNIYSINQSISTLVIGIDNSVSLLNATIDLMFTEMNQQFITVQSTLNYSFSFLNQTIIQLANNITENHIVLYNLIEQRANEIDSSLIDVQTLINLVNNTVADESLVIQTLVNLIGANITNNHIIINNLLNLIDNNITNNNIQLVSILEVIGNNITTNHFVIQTLLDVIGNNITYNHIEMLTNLNLINTTISQNQIELINRLLFINNTMNDVMFELTNQLLFLNGTIYSAVLNLSTSVEFGVDMVIGNLTLTYQQNEFLTELYKQTMFSQLLNWSGVAYNYTLMEDRIDVWEFINNYRNDSVQVLLRYNDLIDNLTISAQNTIDQYLPKEDVEYRLKSVATGEYLSDWEELPENKTVSFGFYEEEIPFDPEPIRNSFNNALILIIFGVGIFLILVGIVLYIQKKNRELQERDKYFNHKLKPTSFSRSMTD